MRIIHAATLRRWEKVGPPTELAKKFGASLTLQNFKNPQTEMLEEFSLFGVKNWSIVCPITKDDTLVLVRQYKQGIDDIVLEFPAGTAEGAEKPIEVALREFQEETGFRTSGLQEIGRGWTNTRKSANHYRSFVALECELVGSQKLDASEEIEVLAVTIPEFWTLVRTQEIRETSTLNTALFAALQGFIPFPHKK